MAINAPSSPVDSEISAHHPAANLWNPSTAPISYQSIPYARSDLVPPLPEFSPILAAVLHFFTLGVFSLIWFNKFHDSLPRLRRTDPTWTSGFWFCLIPIFNLYWIFFTVLRLVERLDEQRHLHGLKPTGCRPLAITFCVSLMIPYYNLFVALPIFGTILAAMLQEKANEIAGR